MAPQLANFTIERLANRRDAFGSYIACEKRTDPDRSAITAKAELTIGVLQRHYRGMSTGDLVGLHSTARDEPQASDEVPACWSGWIALDIDRHDDATDPAATFKAAMTLRDRLIGLGFHVLLLDSNGRSGFHLVVIFDAPIATEKAHAFGRWLIRDWRALGLDTDPEVFPKQPSIGHGGFGNWLRLPGRHHTRDHWTRVWSGERWLDGAAAIEAILASTGSSADLIPPEALIAPAAPPRKAKPKAADYEKDAALAVQALEFLDPHMSYREWLELGMALTPLGREGLAIWDHWSAASSKYQEGLCDRKWKSFGKNGLTLGTLFHQAKARGFEFPKSEPRRKAKVARTEPAGPPPTNPPAVETAPRDEEPERILVEVNTDRYKVVEQSVAALAARDPDIFRRGESLVVVVQEQDDILRLTVKTTMEGVAGSPKILHLSDAVIGDRLTRVCEFIQWRTPPKGEPYAAPAHPPDWLIKTVATRKYWPGIRHLAGVSECPFPRPDGSIVEKPGYDVATGVFYMPSIEFPAIPSRPTRQDARDCWGRIFKYLEYFPFASPDDEVIPLAGMLNVIARPGVIGSMPGTAVNGNKGGCGKELLVHAMTIPGTGRIAPATKYPHNPEEAGKVKTSLARSGKMIVSFDNVEEGTSYGGADIDSLLTALSTDDRILGQTENTGEMVIRIVPFVNGNNITPARDAYRRWNICNLVTELESPEQRDDIKQDKPLRALLLENRGQIVRDLLTILRAHSLSGYFNGGWPPLGSFEDWDRVVRGAVWFATDRDCCTTQFAAGKNSQERREKVAILEGWRELPGGKAGQGGVTTSEALKLVETTPTGYQTLRGVLMQRGRLGKMADPRSVGKQLSALQNSIIDGLKLVKGETPRHGAVLWSVESYRDSDVAASYSAETRDDEEWADRNWGAAS